MHISFNSIADLNEFLNWAQNYDAPSSTFVVPKGVSSVDVTLAAAGGGGSPFGVLKTVGTAGVGGHSVFTAGDGSPADQEARDLKVGPYDPSLVPPMGNATPPPEEPTKRKRRTKAEIDADTAKSIRDGAAAAAAGGQNAGEAALEAARATLRDKEQPTGANPFEVPHTASGMPAPDAGPNPAEAQEAVVTPFQHLTRARSFIAAHGMLKYNESFAKAELDANVMAYTAEQRAAHMAALDALEKA